MNYSQNDEQDKILELFKDYQTGSLLEIGAYDGKSFSNTYALIEKGWKAVLVEPNPPSLSGLITNHFSSENVHVLGALVSPQNSKLMEFWSCNDAVSATDKSFTTAWEGIGVKFRPIWLPVVHPNLVVEFATTKIGRIDFVNIDIEDGTVELVKSMLSFLGGVKVVCVEHCAGGISCAPELKTIFEYQLGFKLYHTTPENFIFVNER